jgi:PPK2 family polyphosphate:nucleotide phosphotransferase
MAYAHLVKPDSKTRLDDVDAGSHAGLSEEEAMAKLDKLGERMADLQELLFAAKQNSLLIVLQGRDTSGKDGSIRRMLHYCNVQSSRVASFKEPTELEASHDFLWRVHREVPAKGDVVVFNRSHYEDVLVVRVHKLVPKKLWKARYDQINAFEDTLVSSGTILLKFYLHISKGEQEKRLLAREENPDKAFKLSLSDWKERECWDDYTEAFDDALDKCSTKHAPWYIVPANHKWFRDLAITQAVVDALDPYAKDWHDALKDRGKKEKLEIEAYRASEGIKLPS